MVIGRSTSWDLRSNFCPPRYLSSAIRLRIKFCSLQPWRERLANSDSFLNNKDCRSEPIWRLFSRQSENWHTQRLTVRHLCDECCSKRPTSFSRGLDSNRFTRQFQSNKSFVTERCLLMLSKKTRVWDVAVLCRFRTGARRSQSSIPYAVIGDRRLTTIYLPIWAIDFQAKLQTTSFH